MLIILFAASTLLMAPAHRNGEIPLHTAAFLSQDRFRPDTPFDQDAIIHHVNDLRRRPDAWQRLVDTMITLWEEGRPPRMLQHLLGSEGSSLLYEVRSALDSARPLPTLSIRPCLEKVAIRHARDVAAHPRSRPHHSSNGTTLTQRIQQHCQQVRQFAECVDHLSPQASTVVLRLLFDPDVPDRGHRRTLLDPTLRYVGAGGSPCSQHPILGNGYVVVLTFGGD